MKKNQTVCFNIKTSWNAIARMYNELGLKEGLTTAIGYVLLNIDTKTGTPATKIGPLLGLESRSLTRMLKSLEENKLIYRAADMHDKRLARIFLTEKGLEKREITRQVVKKFNNTVRATVTEEELEVFFGVIEKINKVIEMKDTNKSETTI